MAIPRSYSLIGKINASKEEVLRIRGKDLVDLADELKATPSYDLPDSFYRLRRQISFKEMRESHCLKITRDKHGFRDWEIES